MAAGKDAAGLLPVAALHRLVIAARAAAAGPVAPGTVLAPAPGEGVAVVGAAGGAGETYLAAALTAAGCPAYATGHRRPAAPAVLIVVGRSTAAHLAAIQLLLRRWVVEPRRGVDLLGVALSADAPMRPGRDVAATAAAIASVVPALWQIGFQPAWRDHMPDDIEIDKALSRGLEPIEAAVAAYFSDDKEKFAS